MSQPQHTYSKIREGFFFPIQYVLLQKDIIALPGYGSEICVCRLSSPSDRKTQRTVWWKCAANTGTFSPGILFVNADVLKYSHPSHQHNPKGDGVPMARTGIRVGRQAECIDLLSAKFCRRSNKLISTILNWHLLCFGSCVFFFARVCSRSRLSRLPGAECSGGVL